jgi:flagellar motility protein MotE (MotC chaperone)
MSKKLIIMIAAAGLISFAGAFAFAWFSKSAPIRQSDELNKPKVAASDSVDKPWLPQPEADMINAAGSTDSTMRKALTEKRLKNLVFEVRQKIQEYNNKLQTLELHGQRLQITRDALKEDIENLNNLQIELASTVASLKEQRDKLLKTRVDIKKEEQANLVSIAATYDKMEATSAGKILTNMCKKQTKSPDDKDATSGLNDAVKILHYMQERTKAKVLAELVTSEPQLASFLCQRLKQISEI